MQTIHTRKLIFKHAVSTGKLEKWKKKLSHFFPTVKLCCTMMNEAVYP
jgi:hypothetical protein